MEKEIKIIGDLSWKECKNLLILKLFEIKSEKEFIDLIKLLFLSIGTKKELEKRRKKLGIHPFTAEDIKN